MIWAAATPPKSRRKGYSQPGSAPVRMRSKNTREKAGDTTPSTELSAPVRHTKPNAAPAPRSRARAKANTLLGLPPGWKASVGSNCSTMPVKAWSNSSRVTVTAPRAGSFRRTRFL